MKAERVNCSLCHSDMQQNHKSKAEGGALVVSIITLATMAFEISFGLITGSMALLADGIHMGTHAAALFITVLAYLFTRKLRANPGFSFGTGKIGVLGGYTNALLLGVTALFMVYETVERLINPKPIHFDSAILVAIIGLSVNLLCAFILNKAGHSHADHHSHDHPHHHGSEALHGHADADHRSDHARSGIREHKDSNLSGALAHVAADAATSVLAIAALLFGKYAGWNFLDTVIGFLGAVLILRWSWELLKDSGSVLLDFGDFSEELGLIRDRLESDGCEVRDLHLWRFSENERSLILTLRDAKGRSSEAIRKSISDIIDADHVTIEVHSA